MSRAGSILLAAVAIAIAACTTQAPPPPPAITVSQTLMQSTPPPPVSTPVPVIRAHAVPNAGRPDPFVALFGPPSASSATPKPVAASSFPKIPTLPGFTAGPGGVMHSIWDGVQLTGIVRGAQYTAIVQVDDQSYIVHEGDDVAGKFRVVSIGPDSVSLASSEDPRLEHTFSLGG